jgi:hypothetical protein
MNIVQDLHMNILLSVINTRFLSSHNSLEI